jgi:hypothetical protein
MRTNNIYTYTTYDGRLMDCSPMLQDNDASVVVAHVLRSQRKEDLIAALESFRNAGELDIAKEIITGMRYGKIFQY